MASLDRLYAKLHSLCIVKIIPNRFKNDRHRTGAAKQGLAFAESEGYHANGTFADNESSFKFSIWKKWRSSSLELSALSLSNWFQAL